MKTRIIHTNFWLNTSQDKLSLEAQHLYIYLITSTHIGLCAVFCIPEVYLKHESRLNDEQLKKAKAELQKQDKVRFYDEWIYVVKGESFVNYLNSPLNQNAYRKELAFIPNKVLSELKYTTIYTTMYSNDKSEIINNKSKIRNQKPSDEFLANIRKEIKDKLK